MRRRTLPLVLLALVALCAPAAAAIRLPAEFGPIRNNPADRMLNVQMDPIVYDAARRCDRRTKPGVVAFTRWLQRNAYGVFWGSYRCERWGRGSASLHAENRAVDWHLDAANPAQKRHAGALIGLLLAPDRLGNPHALARRMGVEEIIWDCSYWGAGMSQFKPYGPCYGKDGRPRRNVGKTLAHRDHIHFGLTKAGAAGLTSFWRVAAR
jgi:hypothetical protein